MVATDIFGRGIDIEKINVVFNYDMPNDSDSYLHRVGRAGRFGTKGLTITFVSGTKDLEILDDIQKRFEVKIEDLPTTIDVSTYSKKFRNLTLNSEQLIELFLESCFQIINWIYVLFKLVKYLK